MNLQDLQEAYNQVHQLDEAVKGESSDRRRDLAAQRREGHRPLSPSKGRANAAKMKQDIEYFDKKNTNEKFDLYNVILSYLLDEGFASTEEAADKIILNMSESWFEDIMERNRYEKETGKDYKTGKEVKKGGTMGGDDLDSKVMRHMHKVMGAGRMGAGGAIQERGKKKEKGKKPPEAGEYGSERESPAQTVAKRRADKKRGEELMHSTRD
jgi:hypothetical protein